MKSLFAALLGAALIAAPVSEVLAQGVALALEDMARGEALPPAIYIAGGGAALPEVADQLRALNWTEHLPFPKTPTIEVLRPEAVSGVYDSTGLLTGTQDITPMGLAYHAIQLDDEEDQPLGGVMRRIMRAMKV